MKVRIRIETEFGWGEKRSLEVGSVERRSIDATGEDLGLRLVEAKSILREIQRALLQDQVEEISELARVCRSCGSYLPIHDRRHRHIDTLFGRIIVDVPRVRVCMCCQRRRKTLPLGRSKSRPVGARALERVALI